MDWFSICKSSLRYITLYWACVWIIIDVGLVVLWCLCMCVCACMGVFVWYEVCVNSLYFILIILICISIAYDIDMACNFISCRFSYSSSTPIWPVYQAISGEGCAGSGFHSGRMHNQSSCHYNWTHNQKGAQLYFRVVEHTKFLPVCYDSSSLSFSWQVFSLGLDTHRMNMAAQHMVKNLTAKMALITCWESLLLSIISNLKIPFSSAIMVGIFSIIIFINFFSCVSEVCSSCLPYWSS